MEHAPADVMHVVAGVLVDADGRVLLAQRPAGKHLAGAWEFPGGKREPGETPLAALARELNEELGIGLGPAELALARPLIRIPWRYAGRRLLLDAWQLDGWCGTPQSLEGQALQWLAPMQVDPAILAPADRPIVQALRLPEHYVITPAGAAPEQYPLWLEQLNRAIERGGRLLQLRLPYWPLQAVRTLAAELLPQARRHEVQLLLNDDIEGARRLGIGVHLPSASWQALGERPLPWGQLVGASCHDVAQLARSVEIGIDFATLSPVRPTASHPVAVPLGWARFQSLAEAASLPVYALGGMHPEDVVQARNAGGQGVAGIGAFWP